MPNDGNRHVFLITVATRAPYVAYRRRMARSKSVNLFGPLLVLALVLGGCMQLISSVFGADDKPEGPVRLPDLVGKQLIEAESQVEVLGLDLSQDGISGSYCPDRTDCVIYRMAPKPGTLVQPGAEVAVRFITADESTFYKKHPKMPKIVGFTEDRADRFLKPVYGTVETERRETSAVPEGVERIIAQSPKPGKALKVGQRIKLIVGYNYGSSTGTGGSGDVDVPNLNWPNPCRGTRWC